MKRRSIKMLFHRVRFGMEYGPSFQVVHYLKFLYQLTFDGSDILKGGAVCLNGPDFSECPPFKSFQSTIKGCKKH